VVDLAHPGMVRREGYEWMTDRCQIRSFLVVIDLSSICNSFDILLRDARSHSAMEEEPWRRHFM
jgi:hypothetical protein